MDDLISREAVYMANEHLKPCSPKDVEDMISCIPSAQQWIPCSERMPEPRVDVWVCSDIGQIQGYYEEHVDAWYASFGQGRDYLELIVNAWMPLPEPYGGNNDE